MPTSWERFRIYTCKVRQNLDEEIKHDAVLTHYVFLQLYSSSVLR